MLVAGASFFQLLLTPLPVSNGGLGGGGFTSVSADFFSHGGTFFISSFSSRGGLPPPIDFFIGNLEIGGPVSFFSHDLPAVFLVGGLAGGGTFGGLSSSSTDSSRAGDGDGAFTRIGAFNLSLGLGDREGAMACSDRELSASMEVQYVQVWQINGHCYNICYLMKYDPNKKHSLDDFGSRKGLVSGEGDLGAPPNFLARSSTDAFPIFLPDSGLTMPVDLLGGVAKLWL